MKPARDFVEEWLRSREADIGVAPSEMKRDDQYAEKFHAWYETPSHLIDITCWNHASCLDIFALNKETGDQDFSVAGECDGNTGLQQRLEELLAWLRNNNGEQVSGGNG